MAGNAVCILAISLFLSLTMPSSLADTNDSSEEDFNLTNAVTGPRRETTLDIIRDNGYTAEEHHVVTEDGYVLGLHRIPYGISGRTRLKRPVVFLLHCLLCSSSDWVIRPPDKALGYLLADAGYDVWLGNARGNRYSRKHIELSPAEKEFWNFSWDEIGNYDVPASIDYVLQHTNSSSLSYIGFSMGTVVFYAMMSEKPQYNDKIKVMIALGPVAYIENMGGPLAMLTGYSGLVKAFADFVGIYEILPGGILLDLLSSIICDPLVTNVAPICDNVMLGLTGLDAKHMNKRLLTKLLAHTPAGTSLRTMIHFMQAKNTGRFQKYNYGSSENMKIYKSKKPPSYHLSKTTVPVALFWSENDWFANSKDVAQLASRLPNVIFNKKVADKMFSHVDFLWSDSAVDLVYSDILKILASY